MAVNKHALVRYKILDKCFRNPGKRYFIDDLIAECNSMLTTIDPNSGGISRRQIFEDIAFMESEEGWSVDLGRFREARKVYYRYNDISFSINNMPLNEVEIDQLKSAIDILSQFKGMPQFEWIHEIVPKLQQDATLAGGKTTIIEFDSNKYLKGIENLGALHNAILYKKVLQISYHPFEADAAFDLTLHPYYLKQYNNRWFVFGYNPYKHKYDWNLALDRIERITEQKGKYEKNTVIDWNEYFEDIIGVTKPVDGEVDKITLHFLGKTGRYIESKPLHGSQKAQWLDDNILEVSLELIINYEFERLILSYADSVVVLRPKKLIKHIKDRISAALEKY